ncbi:MAG: ATP cone domain-containing protein [Kofleriaceae bacterium]
MQCPYCRGDSNVTETRVTADGLRRRRVCNNCKRRFTTYETLGAPPLKVHKRDGSIEAFEGEKLYRALERVAAHRTAVTPDDLRRLARDIEATLVDSGRKSVPWSDIVTLAVARLHGLDAVSARRMEADYRDESGAIRFEADTGSAAPPQLGLPLSDED